VILELKQQVKNLRDDLNVAHMDSDRKSVALLTKVHRYLFTDFMCLCMYVGIFTSYDASKLQ